MREEKGNVLLFSGGLDSTIAHFYLDHMGIDHTALHINVGEEYDKYEVQACKKVAEIADFDVEFVRGINLGQFSEDWYIPHRNIILTAIASNFGNTIYMIATKGDPAPDIGPEAFRKMEHALNGTSMDDEPEISIKTPFADKTKPEIVGWYLANGGTTEVLKASSSCLHGNQCGLCRDCFRKWIALESNGVTCTDWFEDHPKHSDAGIEYYAMKEDIPQEEEKALLNVLYEYSMEDAENKIF